MKEFMEKINGFLKKTKMKPWELALFCVFLVVVIICLVYLANSAADYKKSEKLYEKTKLEYVFMPETQTPDKTPSKENTQSASNEATSSQPQEVQTQINWYDMIEVDLEGLKKVNSEIVGWIFFENEDISYPVLQGPDNDKYMRTTYDGKSATAGSIFMDAASDGDFSDYHTLIYGHNMKNLSMFGKLKYYRTDAAYFDEHKYFQIITENGKYRYEVIACKEVEETSALYTTYKTAGAGFYDFVAQEILSKNSIRPEAKVNSDSHVITLSTCTAQDTRRLIISAVRVDEQ